jgi:hypothetical protein
MWAPNPSGLALGWWADMLLNYGHVGLGCEDIAAMRFSGSPDTWSRLVGDVYVLTVSRSSGVWNKTVYLCKVPCWTESGEDECLRRSLRRTEADKESLQNWGWEGNPAELRLGRKPCWIEGGKETLLNWGWEGNYAESKVGRKPCWTGTARKEILVNAGKETMLNRGWEENQKPSWYDARKKALTQETLLTVAMKGTLVKWSL